MNKYTSLSDLAEGLNKCTDSMNFRAWEKGGKKRIYINQLGYNTKKMSTKVWLELSDTVHAMCIIECPSQPQSWIDSQRNELLVYLEKYVRYVRRFFEFEVATLPIDVIMHNALLDAEEVTGYRTEWRQVRIPLNRFGKLGVRNRQFVIPMKGTRASVPHTFVPCGPEGWVWLQNQGEFMLEPGASLPDADERARLYAKFLREEEERKEAARIAADREIAEKKAAHDSLIATLENSGENIVTAWKRAGCPHPAPAAIVELKKSSGLNWNKFMASL